MNRTGKFVTPLVVLILVVLILTIGVSGWKKKSAPKIDPNVYQAVFLEANQQYFGHLKNIDMRYPYLTDVYYVKVQAQNTQNPAESNFTLVKLGNEIHGPEDIIYLNKDSILFWENLKPDSKVVLGIAQEKAQRALNPKP